METQLNIQVTSSDVVTLLVNDQVERLQAEHDLLQKQIDELGIEENKLIRFAIEERTRLAKEKYGKDIENIVNGLKAFYKDIKVSYGQYEFDESEYSTRLCSAFILNFVQWESGYSNKPIGLKSPTSFLPLITIYQEYKIDNAIEESDLIVFNNIKPIKFNKTYNDNWAKLVDLYQKMLTLANQRNEISNLLKNKEAIKEKAIAEMTRRLVSRNENLQNDIKEIFSTMGSTRLITG